jgi:hypothetical protein
LKYIEELAPGDSFVFKNLYYIISSDFKSNGSKLCFNLNNGNPLWMNSDTIVDQAQIYTMDEKNTIIPIKETTKMDGENVSTN